MADLILRQPAHALQVNAWRDNIHLMAKGKNSIIEIIITSRGGALA